MEVLEKSTMNIVDRLNQPKLICQSNFDSFLSMEEEYTTLLTTLANSQFDEVPTVLDITSSCRFDYHKILFYIEYGSNCSEFRNRNMCLP